MWLYVTLEENHSVHVLYELDIILLVLVLISKVLALVIVLGIKYLYLYLTHVLSTFTCTCTWGFMKILVLDSSTIISTWPQVCSIRILGNNTKHSESGVVVMREKCSGQFRGNHSFSRCGLSSNVEVLNLHEECYPRVQIGQNVLHSKILQCVQFARCILTFMHTSLHNTVLHL